MEIQNGGTVTRGILAMSEIMGVQDYLKKLVEPEMYCFDFASNSFSFNFPFLINIGKKMSLPGFHTFIL